MQTKQFSQLASGALFKESPEGKLYTKDDFRSASYTDDDGNRVSSVFYPDEQVYIEAVAA